MAAGKFTGFGERAVDFYDGLIADNSKAYWSDNAQGYESDVRGPMQALLDDLRTEFGDFGEHRTDRCVGLSVLGDEPDVGENAQRLVELIDA